MQTNTVDLAWLRRSHIVDNNRLQNECNESCLAGLDFVVSIFNNSNNNEK